MPIVNGYLVFSGNNLTNADISNSDLSNIDLTGCNFTNANLTNCDLTNTTLTNCNFTNANLTGATLTDASGTGITPSNGLGITMPTNFFISNGILGTTGTIYKILSPSTPIEFSDNASNLSGLSGTGVGKSQHIDGDYAAIGVRTHNSNAGIVYILKNTSGTWASHATLSSPAGVSYFGTNVYLNNNFCYVTCVNDSDNKGKFFGYELVSGSWNLLGSHTHTNTATVDNGSKMNIVVNTRMQSGILRYRVIFNVEGTLGSYRLNDNKNGWFNEGGQHYIDSPNSQAGVYGLTFNGPYFAAGNPECSSYSGITNEGKVSIHRFGEF